MTHERDDARRDTAQSNSQTNTRGIGLCTDAAAEGLSRSTRHIRLHFFHSGIIELQYRKEMVDSERIEMRESKILMHWREKRSRAGIVLAALCV